MRLMYKQLTRQIFRNKIFVALLLVLTSLTSLSFFFVRFSIDGNMAALNSQRTLTEHQLLYQNALTANTSLAYNFLVSLIGLTAFVFVMFFYRFFRSNRKAIGCLKSLGFQDSAMRRFFVMFAAVISVLGALVGMAGGYFLSSVLIDANERTYNVTGLVKAVSPVSAAVGLFVAAVVFCAVAFVCYGFVAGKEPGVLIAGDAGKQGYSRILRAADAITVILPVKNKFPLRIALRKPVAVFLVLVAVMSFNVCVIMGRSLNISSQTVMDSQVTGHNYECTIRYETVQEGADLAGMTLEGAALGALVLEVETADSQAEGLENSGVQSGAVLYLELFGEIHFGGKELEQAIIGLYGGDESDVMILQDGDGRRISLPTAGGVVIGPGLSDTYGLNVGETAAVWIGGSCVDLEVAAVAVNGTTSSVYVNAEELAALAGLPKGSYNGELRMDTPAADLTRGAQVITRAERVEELLRNAVSNNVSAVINQATGALVGAILIFLALFVSFQDNTRDMLILHLMGYRKRDIRKLLVNVYQPILWASFAVTLAPSIWLARTIQRSLSITTNDYMPFGTNVWVILAVFLFLNVIYLLVQAVFALGIKRIVEKEDIAEYTIAE